MLNSTSRAYDLIRKVGLDIVVFLAPGAAIVGAAVLAGSPGDTRITGAEWITAAVAAIVAAAAIDASAARRARAEARRLAGVRRDEATMSSERTDTSGTP